MNAQQKSYLDGAVMAYRDAASEIRRMISVAPPHSKPFMEAMEPFAVALDIKAEAVYFAVDENTNSN